MTSDQLNKLADLISDKIITYLDHQFNIEPVKEIGPQEFFHHSLDTFGNIKNIDKKTLIATQLQQLEATRDELLEQEKYELLSELKEIYDKLKKEYDEL
ncbi:MAG: hypothetical protein CMP37_03770 [Rickettsiales bacterium]|nr:hypothetical protein [Rickettsiales bacterium]|tara:strand:+ start:953 stop:1249 length:297 start_codon:yes stop_codon:yes gene_type:complete